MNPVAPSRLPRWVRRRLGRAIAAAAVVALGMIALLGALSHDAVWTQARAELLVGTQPHVSGTYGWWDEEVTFEDGRTLSLWRSTSLWGSTNSLLGPEDESVVDVVVFPGEDRAFLVSDVPTGNHMIFFRSLDWMLLASSAWGLLLVSLGLLYGVVRLALGFTPLALPSLRRRSTEVTGVVEDYLPAPTAGRGVLRLTLGTDAYVAGVALHGEQPRPGDAITMGGRIQPEGWALGWTDRGVVVLRDVLRADLPVRQA